MQPHRRQPTRLLCPWDSPGKNTGVGCHFLLQCVKVKSESEVTQSCPTLSDPMDCSLQAPPSMGFSRQECWGGGQRLLQPLLYCWHLGRRPRVLAVTVVIAANILGPAPWHVCHRFSEASPESSTARPWQGASTDSLPSCPPEGHKYSRSRWQCTRGRISLHSC